MSKGFVFKMSSIKMIPKSIYKILCCSVSQYRNAIIESFFPILSVGMAMGLPVTFHVIEAVNSIKACVLRRVVNTIGRVFDRHHGHTLGYPFYGPRRSVTIFLQCNIQERKVTRRIFGKHLNTTPDKKE